MSDSSIPVLDLTTDIQDHWQEYTAAIAGVLRSGKFIQGPNVKAFEAEAADYLGVRHAVSCNSGTDALTVSLRALGVGPGDEVITTPFTFMATASAIGQVGAVPVFVDIDPETLNIDPGLISDKITERTKAIIPVHLYGHAAEMSAILQVAQEHELAIVEDVAQAMGGTLGGQKLGTLGAVGAFSFFPTKTLGGFGDGGMMSTNDSELAEKLRMYCAHGSKQKYRNELIGYNSRLDEIQAAILRPKLSRLPEATAARRRIAQLYNELLEAVPIPVRPPIQRSGVAHVYHQYTVLLDEGIQRDTLCGKLNELGVGTMVYYPVPLHRLPVFSHLDVSLPNSEAAAERVLSLPIWPGMEEAQVVRVVETLRGLVG